jgi:hypothetical protein
MIHYKKITEIRDTISKFIFIEKKNHKERYFFRNIDHNLYCAVSEYQIWIN